MCDLYLFSVQVTSLTADTWAKQPVLLFVDTTGQRHSYVLRDYLAHLLLLPTDSCLEPSDVEEHLGELAGCMSHLDVETRVPLVGFTNARADRVFRLWYADLGHKYRLLKRLETLAVEVLHRRVSDEMLLLHTTGWKLQSWFRMEGAARHHGSFMDHGRSGSICPAQLVPLLMPPMPIPPLSYAFVRLALRSSTATPANVFLPDHTLPHDAIQACELRVGQLNSPHAPVSTILVNTNEAQLIQDIQRWFVTHSPCLLVHFSDPLDHVAYLHFRAKRLGHRSGLSALRKAVCTEHQNMQDETFRDLGVPGRELVDLVHVLQKFMLSPNLDGYTLQDAFAHPKLIRSKATLAYTGDEDVTLQPLEVRQAFHHKELDVMCALQSDNAFLVNNLALSRSCDLSLFQIVSRGQQARVFACFARAYYTAGLYINHTQCARPYLVVKRPRALSSYPDPPWLENPPLSVLRGGGHQEPETVHKRRRVSVRELLGGSSRPPPPSEKEVPKQPKPTKKRFGGGLVMAPCAGFYCQPWEAVTTLDFASLYPSIMEGYAICFMRVCYDRRWLEDPRAEKEYVPLDDETCCVLIKAYDGQPVRSITDRIVHEVVQNRKRVRADMARTTDPFVHQSLDAQQLCCKILQNAFYGACGSETFAVPCNAIAASVCMIGQWMNKTVRHRALLRGGRCIYGDTDSVMLQFPTDPGLVTRSEILADIYRQARSVEAETTALFPAPNAVEFEAVKLPHLQTKKKKTYAAREYPPTAGGWDQPSTDLVKGFAFKKRDRCALVQTLGKALMDVLLDNVLPDAEVVQWLSRMLETSFVLRPDEDRLHPFVITCRLNTEYKQEHALALELATQYEQETGTRPRPGCRLRYVIAAFPTERRKHYQTAVTPGAFVRQHLSLDAAYYLQTQLLLPLKQVLDLRPALSALVARMVERHVGRLGAGQRTLTTWLGHSR